MVRHFLCYRNASPTGWKYGVSIFDEVNNQWFWITHSGMYQWNETTQSYGGNPIGTAQVLGDTDVGINCDKYGNMLIACCEDGFTVLSLKMNLLGISLFQIVFVRQ